MAEVRAGNSDDPSFIELLNALVRGLTSRHAPDQLWIVQIDNWFDHKWLRFPGTGTKFPQDKLTFPPFTPNRVAGQWSYLRVGDHYTEAPLAVLPHPTKKDPIGAHLQRRVQQFSRSACFVWYSASTAANGRGSVMVYRVADDRVECWYAGFNRKNGWKLHLAKGASRNDIQQLLNAK
jgi:hypothetical protein